MRDRSSALSGCFETCTPTEDQEGERSCTSNTECESGVCDLDGADEGYCSPTAEQLIEYVSPGDPVNRLEPIPRDIESDKSRYNGGTRLRNFVEIGLIDHRSDCLVHPDDRKPDYEEDENDGGLDCPADEPLSQSVAIEARCLGDMQAFDEDVQDAADSLHTWPAMPGTDEALCGAVQGISPGYKYTRPPSRWGKSLVLGAADDVEADMGGITYYLEAMVDPDGYLSERKPISQDGEYTRHNNWAFTEYMVPTSVCASSEANIVDCRGFPGNLAENERRICAAYGRAWCAENRATWCDKFPNP